MNASLITPARAERPADRLAGRLSAQSLPTARPESGHRWPANAFDRKTVAGGGITIPRFLTSRIGLNWTEILAELQTAAGSEADYYLMVHGLAEFVETSVIGTTSQPRHGSGLLAGQPLTAGWRRRLYVCPVSNRLQWIPTSAVAGELVRS